MSVKTSHRANDKMNYRESISSNYKNTEHETNQNKVYKFSVYHPPHLRSNVPLAGEESFVRPTKTPNRQYNHNRSCDDIKETTQSTYMETKSSVSKGMNNLNHFTILTEKIRQRENLTELASQNINSISQNEKHKLQTKYENEDFLLNKGLIEDKKRRVMMNHKIKENIQKEHLHKFIKQEKTEVNKYYKNYVENPTVLSGIHKLGTQTDEKAKFIYAQDLMEQTKAKKEKEIKSNIKEEKEKMNSVLYNKKKHDMGELEKIEKQYKMKEEFINMNSSLIDEKRKKEEMNKKKMNLKEKEWLNKLDQDMHIERELVNKYRNEMKNHFKESLNKQISQKNKIRSQSQGVYD